MGYLGIRLNLVAAITGCYFWVSNFFNRGKAEERRKTVKKVRVAGGESLYGEFTSIKDVMINAEAGFKIMDACRITKDESSEIARFGVYMPGAYVNPDIKAEQKMTAMHLPYGWPALLSILVSPAKSNAALRADGIKDEHACPDLMYAIKENKPLQSCMREGVEVVRPSEVMYRFVTSWTEGRKGSLGIEYYIAVDRVSGDCRVLRRVSCDTVKLPGRHRIHTKKWVQHVWPSDDAERQTVNHVIGFFLHVFETAMLREGGINIVVRQRSGKKGKIVFTIPMHRAVYFFKEREDVMTPSGRKRPIFHFVKAHVRQTPKGPVSIKTHMRGSREFYWGENREYHIKIVLPGKHGRASAEFQAECIDEGDKKYLPDVTKTHSIGEASDMLEETFGHSVSI